MQGFRSGSWLWDRMAWTCRVTGFSLSSWPLLRCSDYNSFKPRKSKKMDDTLQLSFGFCCRNIIAVCFVFISWVPFLGFLNDTPLLPRKVQLQLPGQTHASPWLMTPSSGAAISLLLSLLCCFPLYSFLIASVSSLMGWLGLSGRGNCSLSLFPLDSLSKSQILAP